MKRTDWSQFPWDFRPGPGPFGTVGNRYRVICSDRVIRTAVATAEPDSFFTVPARVSVKGKTVTGHVSTVPSYLGFEDHPAYMFTAYTYRKNGDALPEWKFAQIRTR